MLDTGRLKEAEVPAAVLNAGGESTDEPKPLSQPCPVFTNQPSDTKGIAGDSSAYSSEMRAKASAELVRDQEESYRVESSELHGNWTLETAKSRLHQFLQTTRQMKVDYTFACVGLDHSRTWSASITVYAPKIRRTLSASAQASNKQVATKQCALSIVQQLFHYGEVEAYTGPTTRVSYNDPVPPYTVTLDANVEAKLDAVLAALGDDWAGSRNDDVGRSEMVLLSAPAFPDELESDGDALRCVSWSPPTANWNCWAGSNLEPGESEWSGRQLPVLNKLLYEQWQQRNRALLGELRSADGAVQAQAAAAAERRALPVFNQLTEIVQLVENNSVVLVRGETGCGKTTQIAQFILDRAIASGRGAQCNILVTQPRRISAISVAERVAFERGESLVPPAGRNAFAPVGAAVGTGSVGYAVRFETVFPRPYGAILFCTVGVLLRKLADGLRGISHVLVDEIHERDANVILPSLPFNLQILLHYRTSSLFLTN